MNLRFLETFLWVARLHHFRLAAARATVARFCAAVGPDYAVALDAERHGAGEAHTDFKD